MDIVQGGLPYPEFKVEFIGEQGWGSLGPSFKMNEYGVVEKISKSWNPIERIKRSVPCLGARGGLKL